MAILLQPSARCNRLEGILQLDDGARVLKARVNAVPEKGKANAALIRLLSRAWRLPKSSLALTSGRSDRRKTLVVAGAGPEHLRALQEWLESRERK